MGFYWSVLVLDISVPYGSLCVLNGLYRFLWVRTNSSKFVWVLMGP